MRRPLASTSCAAALLAAGNAAGCSGAATFYADFLLENQFSRKALKT